MSPPDFGDDSIAKKSSAHSNGSPPAIYPDKDGFVGCFKNFNQINVNKTVIGKLRAIDHDKRIRIIDYGFITGARPNPMAFDCRRTVN